MRGTIRLGLLVLQMIMSLRTVSGMKKEKGIWWMISISLVDAGKIFEKFIFQKYNLCWIHRPTHNHLYNHGSHVSNCSRMREKNTAELTLDLE